MAVRAALAAPERAAHGRHHRPAGSLREGEERRNLDSLKNTIKANPALAASLAALLLACLALAFAHGRDMRRMVKVDAPKQLLSAVNVPDPAEGITLAEADAV